MYMKQIVLYSLLTFLILFPVGLKYDTISKKLDITPQYEGLHNGPPGFTFIKFPSVFRTFEFSNLQVGEMNTS